MQTVKLKQMEVSRATAGHWHCIAEDWNKLQHKDIFYDRCMFFHRTKDIFLALFFFCSSISIILSSAHLLNSLAHRHTPPKPELNSLSHSPPSISNIYRQLEPDGAVCFLLPWQPGHKVFPFCCFPEDGTAAVHSLHSSDHTFIITIFPKNTYVYCT